MEGLKATIHKFDFGGCKVEMNVMYDDRDGQIFVTESCLDVIKSMVGSRAARSIHVAAVTIDNKDLFILNGFKHEPEALIRDLPLRRAADVIPFRAQQEAFDATREAGRVISFNRNRK